jgi:Mg-chelatase subunit ChlD
MLEKAKYRERSITEVKSVLPQGRLKTRIAIQNSAMKSKGIHSELPAWQYTKRKHTDDPTLTIGVMVDISGSMSSAMETMATTAWVLSEAGRRVQARTAMVYYGQDVFPTLKLGQKLEQVAVYSAPDGTEVFGRGFDALDGHLNLVYGEGVKMLVVVSDGQYTPNERANAINAVKMCSDNGVAVLWIEPKGTHGVGDSIVRKNGVVVSQLEVNEIANVIGRSATDALMKVAVGM